jgi:hypothetical protein
MSAPTGFTRCRGRAELPAALARLAKAKPLNHVEKK